jgi:NADH-quinone oxidoreductase subunit G
MIELEIDGQKVPALEGDSIIEAADKVGIYIPRFCYHKNLSIAANCRMCLVEVEKSGKPLPACATPITSGMKVFTKSQKAIDAQQGVMEYLLINHPLDCPICDQGGECELQDLSMGYGSGKSSYQFSKRAVYNDNLGPLIATEMTRCIQCTRCVRFGEEVAGMRELGVTFRGENEQITTYVHHMMQSELSGNIIDLCPVGALLAKPSRFELRGWELREHPFISPHDCVGSNLFIHSRFQEFAPERLVMRAVPRENLAINETWLSDRDRFSYQGLYHADRIYKPRIKRGHQWEETDWPTALASAIEGIQKIRDTKGSHGLAALASPNSTVEEFFILQKWLRALGSNNVDHRVRQLDFKDQQTAPLFPHLGMKIAEIENLAAIVLIGSDVRTEQPLLSYRMNKAYQEGAKIFAVNSYNYWFPFSLTNKMISSDILESVLQIARALADDLNLVVDELSEIQPLESARAIAGHLRATEKAGIFLGSQALNHPQASAIRRWVEWITQHSKAKFGSLSDGANSAGAWLAGMVPHRAAGGEKLKQIGADAKSLLTSESCDAYFLLNFEPEFDSAYPAKALKALHKAEWVVCFTTYATPEMEDYADVILPIAPFTENEGTFVNVEGEWQQFSPVSVARGESKSAWQVIRVLASLMQLEGFEYETIHHLREELKGQIDLQNDGQISETLPLPRPEVENKNAILRLAQWPMYRVDGLVRRAEALQATLPQNIASISLNTQTSAKYQFSAGDQIIVKQGESHVTLPLLIDDHLADQMALIPFGLEQTAGFGAAMTVVELELSHEGRKRGVHD